MKSVSFFPAFLNLQNKRCVIVGGGRVAFRKACRMLQSGALLKVVAPDFVEDFYKASEHHEMELVQRMYERRDIEGASLVCAASSNPKLNRQVCMDASEAGIWVNNASDFKEGDFIIPASYSQGGLQFSVTTGGASPYLARSIISKLKRQYGESFQAYLELLSNWRRTILDSGLDQQSQHELLKWLASEEVLNMVGEGRLDEIEENLEKQWEQ